MVIIKDEIYLYEYIKCCLFVQGLRTLTCPSPYWGHALVKHRHIVYNSGYLPNFELDPWGSEQRGAHGHDQAICWSLVLKVRNKI